MQRYYNGVYYLAIGIIFLAWALDHEAVTNWIQISLLGGFGGVYVTLSLDEFGLPNYIGNYLWDRKMKHFEHL